MKNNHIHSNDYQAHKTEEYLPTRIFHLKKIFQKFFTLPDLPQLDRWIAFELSQNKKFGSQDRKWYAEELFSVVRNLYQILYILKYKNNFDVFITDITTPEKFWQIVQNLTFDQIYRQDIHVDDEENCFLKANVPFWLKNMLLRRFGKREDLQRFLSLQDSRPALWIRLNHENKLDDVIRDLTANEFTFHSMNRPTTLAIKGRKAVYQLETFQKGFFEIQDFASQEIGYACHIQPGDYVWDVCAGGGGKTVQIASQLKQKGIVYATDIRAYKLNEVKRRVKRAQFFNVRMMPWDGKNLPNFPKEIQNRHGFHCVLVDAPCSASGTWRRHPDAKYKIDDTTVQSLVAIQKEILSVVHQAVKINGTLVYATCSVFKEENEDVVESFLTEHSEFVLENMKIATAQTDDSDTMFVAVMRKKT